MIILTSNRTKLAKTFSLYVAAMMIWSLGSFLMKLDIYPGTFFWNKALQIGYLSVPVLLLRFSYVLTDEYDKKPIVRIGYLISFIFIILAFTGNIISSSWIDANGEYQYIVNPWGAYTFAVVGMTYSIIALGIMVKKTINQEVSLRKVGLVIIGLSLVVIGGASNINTEIGKIGIDILFNTVNAVLITFAIYRNKFLEINLVVKRGISISVYNIVLFTVYAFLVIAAYNIITIKYSDTSLSTVFLIMSPIFLLLEPIRLLLQKLTKHVFYRGLTDRQIVLKEFSALVNSSLDLKLISKSLIDAIIDAINSKKVCILLKGATKYKLRDSSSDETDYRQIYFNFNHPVIRWFKNGNNLLLKNQIDNHVMFKGLWDSEKEMIHTMNTELIVPIRHMDEIVGMVVISGRADDTPYSYEETEFLTTIINNAAAIIENAKTIELIQKQSITDELTKLFNHRYFQDTANEWIKEKRYTRFGLAMIDIDQFKIYNDLYGHASGDVALKRIAEIIQTVTSKTEMLVRYGGEEFVVLYPDYSPEEVYKRAERIRETVESEFLLSKDIREFLTVSIGISNYNVDGSTLEELITKADKAVHQGKQSGRNKTIVYRKDKDKQSADSQVQAQIKDAFISSIYALAATIDAKDHYTYGHSNNVAVLSEALARRAGFNDEQIETVKNAGLLHDIGKVGVPESVLSKPGFLTPDEYEIMQGHVVQSINIIKHIPNLIDTVPVVISHHERYDGKGYPRGIKGESIPILGRVICIADSFDAMTTDRPYRKGLSLEQAVYELRKNSGLQFDPNLVDIFIALVTSGEILELKLENRPSFN
jgi:diguanylate cyclase (GGDEF)-like protein/putative nucleotidyltransferase with HDIG domain